MGDKTNIEWTDATWNPIRGCSRVSEGCRNCYAETVANRFKGPGQPYEGLIAPGGQWNGRIKLVPEKLEEPLRWSKPRRIFVNSMSDLFHDDVPIEYIGKVFAVMRRARWHTFQVLTKRPHRMNEYLGALDWDLQVFNAGYEIPCCSHEYPPIGPLPNVWLGVSVEDQATADERIPLLLQTPAAVRWISAEPLLEPIDLIGKDAQGSALHSYEDDPKLDWVVVGGESGPGARPMHPDWARSLRDQCADAVVPFLFKQWGEWGFEPYPNRGMIPYEGVSAGSDVLFRCGKKKAGRVLDGVLHDGYPE